MFPGDPTNPPAPAPVATMEAAPAATPAPVKKRRSLKGYSFLDAASRAEHPIVSALVANALAGPDAYKLLGALQQHEEARQATMAAASEKRFEYGRNLALKMGDVAPLDPSDPLRPQFEKAFGAMATAPAPEGYQRKPPGTFLRKPVQPQDRPVVAEGGIYGVGRGESGGLEARPIPVLPPLGAPPPAPQGAPGAITKPMPIPSPTGGGRSQPIPPLRGRAPIQPFPTHEPTGAGLFLKPRAPRPPAKGSAYTVKQDAKGNLIYVPKEPGGATVPALDEKGQPIAGAKAAGAMGMSEALTNAEYLLDKMESHYNDSVKKHAPYERALVAGPASSEHGIIAGPAGYMDPDAAIHERNRHWVALALAAPLTGSRKGAIQVIKQIEAGLPSYADNPKVAREFYKQVHAVIANTRRAYPSGLQGGDAADAVYLSELDDALAQARRTAEAISKGVRSEEIPGTSRIDLLTAQAHKRALELQRQKRGGQ